MAHHWSRRIALAAIAVVLISCVSLKVIYRYANVTYETREAALGAQRAHLEEILSKIPPTAHPVGGFAVVILPSVAYAMQHFVTWQGPDPASEVMSQAMNYHATLIVNEMHARGEEVEKRRLFDRVTITHSDTPERVTSTADIALYVVNKGGKAQWFLKNQKAPALITLPEVSDALPPVHREMVWLENVEKMLRSE